MEYLLQVMGLPDLSLWSPANWLKRCGQHLLDHLVPHARNGYRPHLLGQRALALYSLLLLAAKVAVLATLAVGPIEPAFSSAINTANIISLTNESRQQFGLKSLSENSMLDQAAQAKANDMLAKGYFAHVTPDGKTPWAFITAAGYNYLMAGENLAVNFSEAENVEDAWMNSPEHKANILNANFEQIGIGVSQGMYQNHMAIFVVQMFGTPSAQAINLSNTPTKVQTAAVPQPSLLPAAEPPVAGAAVSQPANPLEASSQPVSILGGNVQLVGSQVQITAQTQGPVSKVLAQFGDQAVMLSPTASGTWDGQIAQSELTKQSVAVRLSAQSISGQTALLQLADFAPNVVDNYNLFKTQPKQFLSVLGQKFDINNVEQDFYLLFIALVLTSLVAAIGFKRHIQHLSLIANTSFVVILACLMIMSG